MHYVGFWRRLGAHFIDTMFMQLGMIVAAFVIGITAGIVAGATQSSRATDAQVSVEPLAYQTAEAEMDIATPPTSEETAIVEDDTTAPAADVAPTEQEGYEAESEFGPGVIDVPIPDDVPTATDEPMSAGEAFMQGFREGMEENVDHTPEDDSDDMPGWIVGIIYLAAFGISLIYHTAFVASRWQATPGKRLVGAKVVRASDGGRVGVVRAACRHITCFISWIPLGFLWIMVGVTREKTGLHDVICGTRVVFRTDVPWWNQQQEAVTQPPRNDAITGA